MGIAKGDRRPVPLDEKEIYAILADAAEWASTNYNGRWTTLSVKGYAAYRRAHPDVPAFSTIIGRFGGWEAALRVADLPVTEEKTDDLFLDALRRAAKVVSPGTLSSRQYEALALIDDSLPPLSTVKRHFGGGWSEAATRAGLRRASAHPYAMTPDQITEALRRCAQDLGVRLSELQETAYIRWSAGHPDRPSHMTVRRLFDGSFRDAVERAPTQ